MLCLILLFLLSRYLFHLAGVTVHQLQLGGPWQLIDPELLRHDLLRSVFYLHSQPPLYNLFMGVLVKVFPNEATAAGALNVIYMALGLMLALLVHRLMRRLGVSAIVSFLVTALIMISPAVILYENYVYYTYPATVLLALCAVLFERTIAAFTPWRAFALFMSMVGLIYLRALFQIEWFLVLALFCGWVLPGHRRQVALAAAVPLLLLVALYAKNAAITGQFGTSTWLGMSLSKLTTMQLAEPQRRAMVEERRLSPLALQRPFSRLDRYPEFVAATQPTGIPVLDRKYKSNGPANFNHLAYAAISRQYRDDALRVIHTHPAVYLESVATAYLIFFKPSSDYPFVQENRVRITSFARLYNRVVAGQFVYPADPGFDFQGPGTIGYFIVIGFGLCALYGGVLAIRFLRHPNNVSRHDAVLLFLWMNLLYVTIVGNAVEMGENQRFRFLINPLLVAMLATLAARTARRGLERLRPATGTQPEA